jgi:NAD(P)-dependent dehydrogenase (short-subunit alcohol dehydrogenase family)
MSSVLITGTSSGIGLATALELARAGHQVYATMRKPDQASTLRDLIAREQLPITILPLDVTSDDSVAAAMAAIRSQGRAIEVLVNNAGIEHIGAIEELPFEAFRVTMETNYFGCLRCIRACLPDMRVRKNGCIVNVSSVAGRVATSPMAPYTASKYALEALTEVLAQEVKPFNIRVAVVEPGIIDTPMARRITVPPSTSQYSQASRFSGLFVASLATPTPPAVVAEKIREIIESDTWQLRHPVGPDAMGFLEWRTSMNDEEWVNYGALDDDAWYERVQKDFGLDARAGRRKKSAGTT